MNLTYWQIIKGNRNFRNLLWGQFISELGNWFNFIAALGLVRLVSDASPTAAGILFVARLLPFALFSPIAGTFVDRFSRRTVMIFSDLFRVLVALMFLLVSDAENLWIAYVAMALLSTFGAFFDGAKNAATPNLTGKEGLLAGTALMFSTRFLLMAIGSALGGWAAAVFGYKVAFLINAASFLISAFSVWLIPEEVTRETENYESNEVQRASFLTELKEGFHYTVKNHFALTILLMNVIWATGGGAINVVFERMGGIVFAQKENWNPDLAVALMWTASGFGLFLGMMIAHRASVYLDRKNSHSSFIVWTLIIHGVLFAVAGYMPSLLLFTFFCFVSRAIVGVEYAVQETMFQRSLPDYIRGRISTLDRGAEMTVFGLSSYFSSELMYYISPQLLTVISGVLSASAGVLWFFRTRRNKYSAFEQEEALSDA
jgi:MFS family permease